MDRTRPGLPSHIPPGLGRTPGTAAFWVICAPIIFPVLALAVLPGLLPSLGLAFDAGALGWFAICLGGAAQFAGISLWSAHIGAGPLGGPGKASPGWFAAAVLLGPPALLIPTLLALIFLGDDPSWQFSGDTDPDLFNSQNWTPAYLFYAVFLAPVLEEVTFRGVALGALMARGVSTGLAMLLSSLAFALIHLQYSLAAMAVVFCAGLCFAALRLASGSVLVPIFAHMAANLVMLMLQLLLSAPPA